MKTIPAEILAQHVAVLGKTGSGKTSTAKLAIEQVVAEGARVCVLDPIKSDWWGLTSSRNGKHEGLPFHILGGPHGHVPLHASAGKAVAEIVATGQLPLSIIDMADFEPGGQARFFVDFVPTLLRKMRGVVYLVLEEAHLFAPKERSGIGAENLSIHWAKTMATAGRSKGIRLVLVTQRTQALHNALLGSCDTLIAHRLTAPADQEPVVKWLKANTSKEILEQVSSSLSSLKTGEGWICSGEAKLFEVVQFDRISTYDNTATPTGDGAVRDVKTAAVDREKLHAVIGDAIEQAKQDDPNELKKELARVRHELKQAQALVAKPQQASAAPAQKTVETPVLTDADRELLTDFAGKFDALAARLDQRIDLEPLHEMVMREIVNAHKVHDAVRADFLKILEGKRLQKVRNKVAAVNDQSNTAKAGQRVAFDRVEKSITIGPVFGRGAQPVRSAHERINGHDSDAAVRGGKFRSMLVALAQAGRPLADNQVAARAGMALSGTFDKYLGQQRTSGWVVGERTGLTITDEGLAALGDYEPLPTGPDLQRYWLDYVGAGKKREMLAVLIDAYPESMSDEAVAQRADMALSGTFDKYLGQLRTLQLIGGSRQALVASEELFS